MIGLQNRDTVNDGASKFISNFSEKVGSVITSLVVAGICGIGVALVMTYQQAIEIGHLSRDVNDLKTVVDEVKSKSIAQQVDMQNYKKTVEKLQKDLDDIKYKVSEIPNKRELDNAMDRLYNRLK